MKYPTIVMLIVFVGTDIDFALAQSTPDEIANKFFQLYQSKGSDDAVEYIFSTNKYAANSQDAIDELKRNLKRASMSYGKFWGYELIVKKPAGRDFLMMTFLVKHDRDPLTFRILFYKPNEIWQVQNFKFDNKMDEELEEASKATKAITAESN